MTTRPRPIRPSLAARAFALLLLAQGLALAVAGAAHAHGDTLKVVITGQRGGHVTADVTWENDGDPVEEAVAATVNAVSADGTRTAGAWRLVRDSGGAAAAWTTAEALAPGSWTVTVDAGFPSLGHAEREVAVPVVDPAPPTASATPTASTPPAPATSPAPTQTPASASASATSTEDTDGDTGSGSTGWWTTAGVAGIALAGAAAGILLRRRRLRRR